MKCAHLECPVPDKYIYIYMSGRLMAKRSTGQKTSKRQGKGETQQNDQKKGKEAGACLNCVHLGVH